MAPASIASRISFFIAPISSAVAARSVDSSPMTYRRSGVWPNRAATLIAEPRFSSASRYCGKVSNGQSSPRPACSASRLMPSTFSSVCMISLRWIALGRRDAEAAIADHRRGHAMPGRDAAACGPTGSARRSACARRRSPARRPCRWRRWSSSAGPSALPSATTLPSLMPRSPDEARLAGAVDDRAARDLEVVGHGVPGLLLNACPLYVVRRRREETHGQAQDRAHSG